MRPWAKVRSRQIVDADVEGIVDLLTRGFRVRSRSYWRHALDSLASHPTPAGLPKYGYLLESDGVPVGVILLIFSVVPMEDGVITRCNLSSWYVEREFRSQAPWLVSRATQHKNVIYMNISPAAHTHPIVEAQGFARYTSGQLLALPALSSGRGVDAKVIGAEATPPGRLESDEHDLLAAHLAYGCISLWCVSDGRHHPFVFMPRLAKGFIPCAQLVYCRSMDEFVRFAQPIGRYLARRGRPLVILDADGPIRGIIGLYRAGKSPKYYKGPKRPRVGDLAYTEAVMFGL
jgi:hypothetical protein